MELTESQKNIINIENKNMLVSASAGSGKTFVVVQRILKKIINEDESIDKLLVVTFTNAAAYELKERITKGLYDYLDKLDLKQKEKRAYILNQINKIPMSNISTIHSFCMSVVKDNFYLLGTSPVINIIDEANSKLMTIESILEVLEEEYEKKRDEFLDLFILFKSEENFITILEDIYKYYLTMPDSRKWLEKGKQIYNTNKDEVHDLSTIEIGQNLLEIVKEKLNIIKLALETTLNKIEGLDDFKSRWEILDNIKKTIEKAHNITKYDTMYKYFLDIDISCRLPSSKVSSDELREEVKDTKALASKQIKEILTIMYKDTKGILLELNQMYLIVEYLCEMLYKVDEIYTKKKKEKEVVNFTDIEHLALEALQDETVCKMYKNKFSEIYIDEYQDTSLIQEAIIDKIKRDNNIVRVGDVKQSIYGFRHAKPELFIQKYLSFSDCIEDDNIKIILGENFRSRKEIIDSINYVFGKAMSSTCGGIDYTENEKLICGTKQQIESDNNLYTTELNVLEKELENNKKEQEYNEDLEQEIDINIIQEMKDVELESTFVAEKIKEITNKDSDFKVLDPKLNKYRKCEYKDIVILMRATNLVSEIVENELKIKNIPVYADTGMGFFKSEEINLIINVLKLINNRYDDISLASVMYSIVGSFTLDELTEIRIDNKNIYLIESIYKYIEQGENEQLILKLQQFIDFLDKYTKYLNIYNLSEIILKIYEETGIYDAMLLEDDADIKQVNLDAFLDIVSNYEKKEISSLVVFLNYIDNLSKKGGSSDAPKTIGENENVVRIMTIHKSKGLEFPVVIIMNTNKKYNEQDTKSDIFKDEKFGIGINILNKEYNICYPSVIKQVIKSKMRTEMISEELRLLYVAMTRAKDKLLIYGTVPSCEKFANKIFSNKEGTKLAISTVKHSTSYLKLIAETLSLKSDQIPFKINLISVKDVIKNVIEKDERYTLKRGQSIKEKIYKLTDKDVIEIDEKYLKSLKEKFDTKYKYERGLNIQQKYTATELKQIPEDKTNLFNYMLSNLKPNIIEKSINETSYGTFIHKVIENLDMRNITKEHIVQKIELELCKIQNRQAINVEKTAYKIQTMFCDIKHLLNEAKEIYKEYEFVINDDLKGINQLELKQKTLIQGVIDLYIVTKAGDHIIIDYKTDKIDTEQELINRYKYQLYVYKRAVEISHNTNVKAIYIYSFYLNKLIEIK